LRRTLGMLSFAPFAQRDRGASLRSSSV
jgi:hypothetical protein